MGQKKVKTKARDLMILDKYAELLKEDPLHALKRAIMEVCNYSPDDKYLSTKISYMKKKLNIAPLEDILTAQGITKHSVASKIRELMDAKKPVVYQGALMKDEDGNAIETPDNVIQMKATALSANILGLLQKGSSIEVGEQTNNIMVLIESEKDARERVEESKARNEVIQESYKITEEAEQEAGS